MIGWLVLCGAGTLVAAALIVAIRRAFSKPGAQRVYDERNNRALLEDSRKRSKEDGTNASESGPYYLP